MFERLRLFRNWKSKRWIMTAGNRLITLRQDYPANWEKANPILAEGEPAIERGTGRIKLGDGKTHWIDLPYGMDGAIFEEQEELER